MGSPGLLPYQEHADVRMRKSERCVNELERKMVESGR
jgi:hypothetical protein